MEILSRLNWVDLLAVIIMLRTIYMSFQNGLSHEIFPFFSSILKLVLALHFYGKLGSLLNESVKLFPLSLCNMASFLAIVLITTFVLNLLSGLLDSVINITWHPLIEKIGGMMLGVLKGAVSVSMVLIFLALIPLSYIQWSINDKSLYGMFFLRIGPAIYRRVSGGAVDDKKIIKDIISKKEIPVSDDLLADKQPKWERVIKVKEKKLGGSK